MTLITQPEVQGNGTDVTNEQVILLGMVLILIEDSYWKRRRRFSLTPRAVSGIKIMYDYIITDISHPNA